MDTLDRGLIPNQVANNRSIANEDQPSSRGQVPNEISVESRPDQTASTVLQRLMARREAWKRRWPQWKLLSWSWHQPSPHGLDLPSVERGLLHKKWVRELGNQLYALHWDAYFTLTFRHEVTYTTAKKLTETYLQSLGPDIAAYIAYEQGEANLRTHVHLLATLLPACRHYAKTGLNFKALRVKWAGRKWPHGDADAEVYDPRRGACWYVAKFPSTGEFYGRPRRHKKLTSLEDCTRGRSLCSCVEDPPQ